MICSNREDVESFIVDNLRSNNPILVLNLFVGANNTRYLLNNSTAQVVYGEPFGANSKFDNHWMTITKFFIDRTSSESYAAIATWGSRISINAELMRNPNNDRYHSQFRVFEIRPE